MQDLSTIKNDTDLGFSKPQAKTEDTGLMASQEARAVAEVQASYVIAKKFPRNQHQSYMDIIDACKRPFLAEQAMYAYPRGGTLVTGPSIRLAEAMAQCWGNLDCGVREISQSNGVSVAEAYAIDLQTNTRVTKIFHVPHVRDTKKGRQKLTDARDIYELVANNGSRRLRACILGILPGDVVEAAVNQCKKTMESGELPMADRIRMMVAKFDELGVKVEHLEKRLGHNLAATIPAEIVTLQGIYKAIKDGFAGRDDFFEIGGEKGGASEANLETLLAEKSKKNPPKAPEVPKDEGILNDKKQG
jgi:hypothetical protein